MVPPRNGWRLHLDIRSFSQGVNLDWKGCLSTWKISRLYCHGQCHQHHQCPEEKHQAWQREIKIQRGNFFLKGSKGVGDSVGLQLYSYMYIYIYLSLLAKGLYIYIRTSLCLNQYIHTYLYIYIFICIVGHIYTKVHQWIEHVFTGFMLSRRESFYIRWPIDQPSFYPEENSEIGFGSIFFGGMGSFYKIPWWNV